jgi:hypothetical protein
MAPDRRKLLLLIVLAVVLAVAVYSAWPRTADRAPSSSNVREGSARPGARTTAGGAPDVRLEALSAESPQPGDAGRNLFHFGERRAAASPEPEEALPPAPTPVMPGPGGPQAPQVPAIALKFIGIVEAPERGEKFAVLSDGRFVHYGREGDTIEGRYQILRIGAESIEMAHLDGTGRQTIRLSGS